MAGFVAVGAGGAVAGGDVEVAIGSDDGFAAVVAAGGPFDDDAFGAGLDARRLGGAVDFEAGDAGELAFFAAVIAGVGGGEDEDVAVVLVAGMEGEGGDAAAHIEDEVFFSGGVGGVEGVEAAFVFGDPEAGGEGVLGDEDGSFKRDLGEGAGEAEGRGRVGGAGEAVQGMRWERP
ncbi:MAG: hypothetical protein ACK6D7_07980 [Acidobacteriota bacterium]